MSFYTLVSQILAKFIVISNIEHFFNRICKIKLELVRVIKIQMQLTVVKVVFKVDRPRIVYKMNTSIQVRASKKTNYRFSFNVVIVISKYNTDMPTKQ